MAKYGPPFKNLYFVPDNYTLNVAAKDSLGH